MLRKNLIILALTLVLAASPSLGQVAQGEMSLDALEGLNAKDAKALGLTPKMLQEIESLGEARLAQHPPAFEANAKAGLLISAREDGVFTASAVPADTPDQIIVHHSALAALREYAPVDLEHSALANRILRNGDTERTLDPRATDVPLPAMAKARAQIVNWTGPAGTYPQDCVAKRASFSQTVEQQLLGDDSDPTQPRADDERQELITIIHGYDDACLVKVTPQSAAAQGWPIGFVAIVSSQEGQAYCMAAYLGGRRFLTARHCLFDNSGQLRPGAPGSTLSLADRSAVRMPLTIAPIQPIPAPRGDSSRADLVLVTADVPPAVAARPGPVMTGPNLSDVMISKALVIGYFVLADPEHLIPSAGDKGQYPEWSQSLRATREIGAGYCRVFDYTSLAADGTGCIQHSCQTVPGFSGTPVFIKRDDGQWTLGGIHVTTGADAAAKQCTAFVGKSSGGVLGEFSGLAAEIPSTIQTAGVAQTPIAVANR